MVPPHAGCLMSAGDRRISDDIVLVTRPAMSASAQTRRLDPRTIAASSCSTLIGGARPMLEPTALRRTTMTQPDAAATRALKARRDAPLATPTDLKPAATKDIAAALNGVLADVFALYLKTKNFHWHMSGPHFRDYHLMLDEQSEQLFAMTDPLAERIRKVGGRTLRSIGHIARTQRVLDNDAEYVEPADMLAEVRDDNQALAARLREAHDLCNEHRDIASASLIEVWIDETERRTWFLFESGRRGDASGN
jgi:starvation-inducible DNA-binding protein